MPSPPAGIRRVVTAHDKDGKAVVMSDGVATNARTRAFGGFVSTLMWMNERTPAPFSNGADLGAATVGVAPPAGGAVFRVVDFPPVDEASLAIDQAKMHAEMGVASHAQSAADTRHPFTHRTRSVDYAVIMSGEIDMLLDDSDVHLRAGDIVVQQGTNHAWVNRGPEPCRIAFILIDAE